MKKQSANIMERLVAGVTMFIAFLVMASIFVPHDTRAQHESSEHAQSHESTDHSNSPSGHPEDTSLNATEGHAEPSSHSDSPLLTTDPHEGLSSIGSLIDACFETYMYATPYGPRYSIYDLSTGDELAVLLTVEQVDQYFPEIALPGMEFSSPTQLMMVNPADGFEN